MPSSYFSDQDQQYMQLALALAERNRHITTPNPAVGCVLVKAQQCVGQGATQAVGGSHAEICALKEAKTQGHDVAGATAYVTLEPCSHFGRTPPCVDALIAADIRKVVIALLDPNPLVAGRGVQRLQAAGIEVQYGLCAEQALQQNLGFMSAMTRQKVWLRSKIASSLDGQVALVNGVSQWITGALARTDGQRWRALSSVVLTGIGTVLADNPLLNVRDIVTPRQPLRALIDRRFRIAPDCRLLNGDEVLIFVAPAYYDKQKAQMLEAHNAKILCVSEHEQGLDLHAVLQSLYERQLYDVHLEAGPRLNAAFLQAGLIDEIIHYQAPTILGPGQSMMALEARQRLPEDHEFAFIKSQLVGSDLCLQLRHVASWQDLKQRALGAIHKT
ncbi:bifunctional diaminohydroxyphosphoribosylaminopyrimidine deaminase/5-amino-6-(5-phosphoribosylamino)uracil reductase RibD [Brackiella oedipodis]|uniref:bifunctional diaminohydroxyphosphoribosylaminopyrimidine deaminase/5-amino-6-(5-phosphoribosylamino)uracil reductase RibD n=1 Tax=Brackiella oedipodis TaxID=124225 RepID=UPI00049185F7|nr:bifunctional diaminohydroxyphosphoribosylaminopyrimidine deaminase/5-amino-6-(5-phosphoribosylamino)uracil reductase RibD [Brackiella oedipodis]